MLFFAGTVCYNFRLTALLNVVLDSNLVKRSVSAVLLPNICCSYQKSIWSYKYFALYFGFNLWAVMTDWPEKWAVKRIIGFQVDKQDQVFLETLLFYLSLLHATTLITEYSCNTLKKAAARLSHYGRQTVFFPEQTCLLANDKGNLTTNYQISNDRWWQTKHRRGVQSSINKLNAHRQDNFNGHLTSGLVVQRH